MVSVLMMLMYVFVVLLLFVSPHIYRFTAKDAFGHLESEHSTTAANAFKYERWHTMVLFRKHHPLNWDMTVFLDVFKTANKW